MYEKKISIKINITLNNKKLQIILNSNVLKKFVMKKYIHYYNLSVRRKTIIFLLILMNESVINNEKITNKTTIMLKIDKHREKTTLNIMNLINHDVILNIL